MGTIIYRCRMLKCTIQGLLMFFIAFLISLTISNFTLDSQIASVGKEEETNPCYSKEFSIEDRIEYSFKNTMLAEYAYKEALDEKNEKKRRALFERAERNCKQAIAFYPFENYSYVLLRKIYANGLTNKNNDIIISTRLRNIEDEFAVYYIKYYSDKDVLRSEIK